MAVVEHAYAEVKGSLKLSKSRRRFSENAALDDVCESLRNNDAQQKLYY